MNIYFDCDDVLLDWYHGFTRWARNELGMSLDPAGPLTWDLSEWMGVDDAMPLIRAFNQSPDFGGLQPRAGAVEAVLTLRQKGFLPQVITSCNVADDPKIAWRRTFNIHNCFGIIPVTVLNLGEKKVEFLASRPRGIWVEDNHGHAIDGASLGHRTFLMTISHNSKIEVASGITRVDSFAELLSHLT